MTYKLRSGLAAVLAAGALAACTQSSSQIESTVRAPRPQVVVVQTFAVQPSEVQLDPGLSGTIAQTMGGASGPAPNGQSLAVAQQVANALADKLVADIRDLGFQAQRGNALPPGVGRGLLITGQFVAIDQGNRAERVAIGLGEGQSDVVVRAQVFDAGPRGKVLADEIEVDAKSGMQPGMAETMGVGALTGHFVTATLLSGGLQVADESLGATVVADADRAAKGISKQLASFFAQQGWTR